MKKLFKLFSFLILLLVFFLFIYNPLNSLKDLDQAPEIILLDQDDNEIIHLINNHKITPVKLEYLSQQNIDILLDIEDKNFYSHSGFNLGRIIKTVVSNVKNNQSYGASTITQQYIKNIYLDNSKKITRKLKEIYLAIKLEQISSKNDILEGYLNCIYFGNDIYGLANASKYYFNKDYSKLTIKEMTFLVALLNAPTYLSNNLDKLEIKKNQLLNTLYLDNIISKEDYLKSLTPIELNINPNLYSSNLLFFLDEVLKEYKALNIRPKLNQKITIKTMYNQKINKIGISTNANYAGIAVNKDGYIISMIGGNDYSKSSFNIATSGNRDIGSTIKPLLYYEALKCGLSINQTYYSAPYSFNYKKDIVTISNYGDIYPFKNINMRYAIATSDNIYAMKVHQAIGFKTLANHLKKYNIKASSIPSLALGSVGMSLYDLTRIYTQFFTSGEYLKLQYIKNIKADDKLIYQSKKESKILGNTKYFSQIKQLMNSIFDASIPHSTASFLTNQLESICYGKSGLTDFDAYMMGFNDDILVGVWSGYLDNKKLDDLDTKRIPKQLFKEIINAYEKEYSYSE